MEVLLFLGGLSFLAGVSMIIYNSNVDSESIFWGLILLIIGELVVTLAIASEVRSKYPSALDVYNGKTHLEITYRDSIPIDSVVVFKK